MRKFHFVPSISELDVTINEENFIKAWKIALDWFFGSKESLEKAKALTDNGEERVLYDLFSEAVNNDEYPVLTVHPCGSEYIDTYRLDELEDEFSYEFFSFCSEILTEMAVDLGLLY